MQITRKYKGTKLVFELGYTIRNLTNKFTRFMLIKVYIKKQNCYAVTYNTHHFFNRNRSDTDKWLLAWKPIVYRFYKLIHNVPKTINLKVLLDTIPDKPPV